MKRTKTEQASLLVARGGGPERGAISLGGDLLGKGQAVPWAPSNAKSNRYRRKTGHRIVED